MARDMSQDPFAENRKTPDVYVKDTDSEFRESILPMDQNDSDSESQETENENEASVLSSDTESLDDDDDVSDDSGFDKIQQNSGFNLSMKDMKL